MTPELEMLLEVMRMLLLAGLILMIFHLWLNTPEDIRRNRKSPPPRLRLKEPMVVDAEYSLIKER